MSFTTTYTYDADGRLTRKKRVDDANPTTVYNQQDFTYDQRDRLTGISNTVAGGMGTADTTRAMSYNGLNEMVTLSDDPGAPTSALAWHAGKIAYEKNGSSIALYRWGPTGLVEFAPSDPERVAFPALDIGGGVRKLTNQLGGSEFFTSSYGQREAAFESPAIGSGVPDVNRVQGVGLGRCIRLGLLASQNEAYVDTTGRLALPGQDLAPSAPDDRSWAIPRVRILTQESPSIAPETSTSGPSMAPGSPFQRHSLDHFKGSFVGEDVAGLDKDYEHKKGRPGIFIQYDHRNHPVGRLALGCNSFRLIQVVLETTGWRSTSGRSEVISLDAHRKILLAAAAVSGDEAQKREAEVFEKMSRYELTPPGGCYVDRLPPETSPFYDSYEPRKDDQRHSDMLSDPRNFAAGIDAPNRSQPFLDRYESMTMTFETCAVCTSGPNCQDAPKPLFLACMTWFFHTSSIYKGEKKAPETTREITLGKESEVASPRFEAALQKWTTVQNPAWKPCK